MSEKDKFYWEVIHKIAELQNDVAEEEKKLIDLDGESRKLQEKYIQEGYVLIRENYNLLYEKGYKQEEIDIDVAYS